MNTNDADLAKVIDRYIAGEISAPVTLMQLLIETESFEKVQSIVDDVAGKSTAPGKAKELADLLVANAEGCTRIASMLRADVDSPAPARSIEEGIAFSERLFDWSVQQSEEASVALYSLGNPELLERATAEIVDQLDAWGAVSPQTRLLDLGCGIGRMLIALGPKVRSAVGTDVSTQMVEVAKRRCAALRNVTVQKADGRDLSSLPDASFDVVLAVDSFPYIRQSGYALAATFVSESRRVLAEGGQLVILNYSYSDDDQADRQEIAELAARNGFEVMTNGERLFELWDGLAFHLMKPTQ